jgi:hypothetical protein
VTFGFTTTQALKTIVHASTSDQLASNADDQPDVDALAAMEGGNGHSLPPINDEPT